MDADLFEGDIVLEPVQRLAVDLGIEIRGSMENRLWPNAIVPYTIAPSLCKKNFSVLIRELLDLRTRKSTRVNLKFLRVFSKKRHPGKLHFTFYFHQKS